MKKKMTSVPFEGTAEQEKLLCAAIESHKGQEGSLLPVLQEAQDIYGYLPEEVQRYIALKLGVPYSEVYGVVTFYSQFLLNPKGENAISVCLGTACYVKGSAKLVDRLSEELGVEAGGITSDLRFSLDVTRCIGACGLAPVMTIGEDVYGRLTPDQIPDILKKYN